MNLSLHQVSTTFFKILRWRPAKKKRGVLGGRGVVYAQVLNAGEDRIFYDVDCHNDEGVLDLFWELSNSSDVLKTWSDSYCCSVNRGGKGMMKVIKYFVLAIIILFSISISADENNGEEEAVVELFFEYLDAYSDSDFHKAATFVHPQHLRDYEQYTLPVLIEAKNHPLTAQHMIVEVFFEGVPDEKIYELTGAQVSARLDRAMVRLLPVIIESARLENINIKSVDFLNENRARVSYDYHPEDGGVEELEDNFAKYDGAWRILLPESPKQAAESLKSLFE